MTGPARADDNTPESGTSAVVRDVEIVNKLGLHARAAMKFVQTAEQFKAAIAVARGHESVDGTSILDILMLAAGQGATITITATGEDAPAAMDALCVLVSGRFGEED